MPGKSAKTAKCRGTVLAAAAHPDDIEFMMAGTLFLLRQAGFDIHYLNVANGNCGTTTLAAHEIVTIRTEEARQAAACLNATFHPPYTDDIEIYYEPRLAKRLCALVREVAPDIILLQSPQDYMEDHVNSSRLLVTAAFCRGMRNYVSDPPRPPTMKNATVYHALPYGLHDQLRKPVIPEFYVNTSRVMVDKRRMLACHRSQKEWLDQSQGLDSYLQTMEDMGREVGRMSGRFEFAEGWRRHLHGGFCGPNDDPLGAALKALTAPDPRYATLCV